MSRFASKHFALLASIVFLLTTLAFFWPVLFRGQTLIGGDIVNQYLPYKQIVREQILQGHFPHWNPLTFSGRPLQADIQVGVFYPPNVVFCLLPVEWGFDLTTAFHFFLGSLGMALWVRRRARHAVCAYLAGALYMLNGFATTRLMAGIVLFHYAMSWLPWLLLCWDRFLEAETRSRRRRAKAWAALVAVCAMEILAGAPQIAFYSFFALGLYALIFAWGRRPSDVDEVDKVDGMDERNEAGGTGSDGWLGVFLPFRLGPMLWLAGALLLAVGICAVQILPTLMFIGQSWDRAVGATWPYIADGSLRIRDTIKFVAPFFFGHPFDEAHFWGGPTGYHETTAFAGAVPLLLVLSFFALRWRRLGAVWLDEATTLTRPEEPTPGALRRFELFLILLLVLSVSLAFGRHSPFFWLAYHFVPGFDRFRVPARLLLFLAVALSGLGAWTLDRIMAFAVRPEDPSAQSARRARNGIVVLTALGLLALAAFWVWTPRAMRALEMPFYRFESAPDRLLADAPRMLERQARSSLATFTAFWVAAGLALILVSASPLRHHPRAQGQRPTRLAPRAAAQVGAWALFALVLAQLFVYGRHFLATVATVPRDLLAQTEYPRTDRIDFLAKSLAPGERFLWFDSVMNYRFDQNHVELWTNRAAVHGLPQLRGYDPVNSRLYGLVMNLVTHAPLERNPRGYMLIGDDPPGSIDWRLVALWNCRLALSYSELVNPAIEEAARWEFAPGQILRAYRLKHPSGAAWLAQPFVAPPGTTLDDMLRVLTSPRFEIDKLALVEADEWNAAAPDPAPRPALSESVRRVAAEPNSQRFDVSTPRAALLAMSQVWYPGWRARVDGVAAPVLRCNAAQIAVPLAAGRHEVEVYYRPGEFTQGAAISLASLFLLGLIAWNPGRQRDEEVLFR